MSSTPKPDTPVSIVSLGRRRIHCHLLLPAIGILVITAGLGLALILYLLANKIPDQTLHQIVVNGSFYADEGLKYTRDGKEEVNLRGLLITSLTGHLISVSVPMVMSMVAFRLAAKWVSERDTDSGDDTDILPTPQQYGLLLTLCSSASLNSLYQCVRCILAKRSGKPTISSLIIQAFWVLAVVSTLSIAVGLADTWLHAAASAVLYSPVVWAPGDALSAPAMAYGTGFNDTVCSQFQANSFCGQASGELWGGDTSIVFHGYEVAGNQSTKNLVTTLNSDDLMAIVTRPAIPENVTYIARSLGLAASCVAFSSRCTGPGNILYPINCGNLGPEAQQIPIGSNEFQLWKSGDKLLQGVTLDPPQEKSNIFNVLAELYYQLPTNFANTTPPSDAIVPSITVPNAYMLLANCSFAAYDVVIQAAGVQITLVNKSDASDETTGRLWVGLLYGFVMDLLVENTRGVALTSGTTEEVMADFSQEIARLTLAAASGILAPIAPESAGTVNSKLVSAYPFAPLALFLGLLAVYSATATALFLWCAFADSPTLRVDAPENKSHTVSLVQLVQMRIANPLSFVASVFDPSTSPALFLKQDPVDPANVPLSLQTDTKMLFNESRTTARLHVGFTSEEGAMPQFVMRQGSIK